MGWRSLGVGAISLWTLAGLCENAFGDHCGDRVAAADRSGVRLSVTQLEDRVTPSVFGEPETPILYSVDAYSDDAAYIQFEDPGATADSIVVEVAQAGGTYAEYQQVPGYFTASTITGLTTGEVYFIRLYSYNALGASSYSNEMTVYAGYTGGQDYYLVTPNDLHAQELSSGTVELTWTDSSYLEDGYGIARSRAGGPYEIIDYVPTGSSSYVDYSAAYQTEYRYKIFAYKDYDTSDYSNSAYVMTTLPFPLGPTGLTVTALSSSAVRLTWIDNSQVEAGYLVFQRNSLGEFEQIDSIGANRTAYTVSGLPPNRTVEFVVQAYNDTGYSDLSNPASATTQRLPVPSFGSLIGVTNGFAVSDIAGGSTAVQVYDADESTVVMSFEAFPGFPLGASIAIGDITGDGVLDVGVAAAAGGGPHIKIIDGATRAEVQSYFAYAPEFRGGANIAFGDVTGDGRLDVITGAGSRGGPHVIVKDGVTFATVQSFMAYAESFTGGVRVAAGDTNGDGKAEIITVPMGNGGPHLKVFDGADPGHVLQSFYAYDPLFTGGVYVGAGDLDGDGLAEIVTGPGKTGGPHVKVFDPQVEGRVRQSFFAYDPRFTGGVTVAVGTVNGQRAILTGAGPGGGPHARAFRPFTPGPDPEEISGFMADGDLFFGGVYVGGNN